MAERPRGRLAATSVALSAIGLVDGAGLVVLGAAGWGAAHSSQGATRAEGRSH